MKAPEETWDKATLLARAEPWLNTLVTAADAQELEFCATGQRRLFHSVQDEFKRVGGVSFEQFVREGAPLSWLIETENPYAWTLAQAVIKRLEG